MPRRARPSTCLFAPVLLAISLAACGEDGDPLASATDPPTTDGATDGATGGPATSDPTGGTGDPGGSTGAAEDPAWMSPYCFSVADGKWLAAWRDREQEVLDLVNAARAQGADCGGMGQFGPAGPLALEARLHCAARKHSQDMAERSYFDHTNPDGEDPFDRMAQAGYTSFAAAGENIAAGSDDPALTVQGWLDSDGHCANMMNPQYQHLGVGFYEGPGPLTFYWTQVFAAPN